MDAIRSSGLILTGNMENILTQAVDTVNSSEMYTPRAFEGGTKARDTLTYSMSDLAEADRATVGRAHRRRRERGRRRGGVYDR